MISPTNKYNYSFKLPNNVTKRGVYIPFNEGKREHKIIFLEILGAVESFLCQLAALICYSLPVGLTHDKADSALSICVLLLFKISPSDLNEKESHQDTVL